MKEAFIEHRFNAESEKLIGTVNGILKEYSGQGYKLSLRQLYYQLVARGYIENSIKSYKRTGDLVSNARLAGLIDWGMIEDRGRETVIPAHWVSPAERVRFAAENFRVDHWEGQPCYVEVMVEKDALSGILEPVCWELDVRFTANKGYSSSSAMYEASKRIARAAYDDDKEVHLFYLGDHDPSGIDMTRDIKDRLALFTHELYEIETVRLALNYDQVEQWDPPENPAKEKDSRYQVYVEQFGESSWELDAVEPATLAGLVEDAVKKLIDQDIWDEVEKKQSKMRADLIRFADEYENRDEDEDEDGEE